MRFKIFLLLIPALVLTLAAPTHAWWFEYTTPEVNMPIATDPDIYEGYPHAFPYPDGSTLVVFNTSEVNNCYQIIDRFGDFKYQEPQRLLPALYCSQLYAAHVVTDGCGGVIAVWCNGGTGPDEGFYAQRLDSLGNLMWGDSGVSFYPGLHTSLFGIASDGQGGVFGAFSFAGDLRAQHIDISGQFTWGEEGIVVCDYEDVQTHPRAVRDDQGGAYFTWEDFRGSNWGDIYMQRVDEFGNTLWNPDGLLIYDGNPWLNELIPDGEGGFILHCGSGGYNTAYRIAPDSHILWECYGVSWHAYAKIIEGDPGYFYLGFTWEYGYWGQWMDMEGNCYWPTYPSGRMGALLARKEDWHFNTHYNFGYRNPYFYGVYNFREPPTYTTHYLWAQRLNADGDRMWGEDGTLISVRTATNGEYIFSNVTPDTEGGAAVVFEISCPHDVWAKHVNDNGSLGGPNPQVRPFELYPQISSVSEGYIQYEIPEAGQVNIELYNLLGKRVTTIQAGYHQPGKYTTHIDQSSLSSGIYFLRLHTPTGSNVSKMVVMR
ncbi:hypothetical protein CEE37_12595 [candidate division LCP-89 bacterium B3_LCP]|uniref:Secretion system C-terminal sorting domain-containing protein n=1 Tax=candidate division LCP-89 bacterium B3_LCP TaxID=2012998 RepID=A0A532UU12_UNCL8|nr:MAG: hypothetical protein CEE37_12595 [candidate division LCP-89 bacterium B3_LCP]